jgi:hypothetical protein
MFREKIPYRTLCIYCSKEQQVRREIYLVCVAEETRISQHLIYYPTMDEERIEVYALLSACFLADLYKLCIIYTDMRRVW